MIRFGMRTLLAALLLLTVCGVLGCHSGPDPGPLPHDQSENANAKPANLNDTGAPGAKGGVKPPPP